MINNKKIVCIIPARLASTRLPNKVLLNIQNKPMLQHVWERAHSSNLFDDIFFAIDDKETADLIDRFHGKWYMTPKECESGTKRLAFLVTQKDLDGDVYVNWQADEPFLNPATIELLLSRVGNDDCSIWTLFTKVSDLEEALDPSAVKVVLDKEGKALYFSRSIIPYMSGSDFSQLKKHIGIYAYTKEALKKIGQMESSILERLEKLEQLTFLYNALSIRAFETKEKTLGIDTLEDLEKANRYLYI
ncbi:MAG: 3-deoxy-manno-octulosonate cytidylyltransferase [Chlamydiae bacterium]|nr:3-deoxy-manno-octulosonate cytidylyltransferase [Chlamydiota bacterium]